MANAYDRDLDLYSDFDSPDPTEPDLSGPDLTGPDHPTGANPSGAAYIDSEVDSGDAADVESVD